MAWVETTVTFAAQHGAVIRVGTRCLGPTFERILILAAGRALDAKAVAGGLERVRIGSPFGVTIAHVRGFTVYDQPDGSEHVSGHDIDAIADTARESVPL